jgi:DNA-binding LacI/PurR family transcriptional regulator
MNNQRQITLKDIAQQLKLSVSTVSRALKGSTDINAETSRQVLALAEELKYSPDPIALSLKEKKTKVIGVMVQEIANNYCSAVIAGIENFACKMGYQTIISQSHEKYETEVQNTRLLASRRIDGLIISISNETRNTDHLQELIDKGIPVVMFDRVSNAIATHKVIVDDYRGAFEATCQLIEQGYENIAHITISKHLLITQNRLKGFTDALRTHHLPVRSEWILHCDFNTEATENKIRRLFCSANRPDAVLLSVERLSITCLKVLRELELQVPDDVALAGFSDNPLSPFLNPALTSVCQPTFAMGQLAVELLIELIESKQTIKEYKTVQMKTTLHVHESSLRKAVAVGEK